MNDQNDKLRRIIGFSYRIEHPQAFQQIQATPLAVQHILCAQGEKVSSFKLTYSSDTLKRTNEPKQEA